MNRFIVETDTDANTKHFLMLMRSLKYVRSVIPVKGENFKEAEIPDDEYNWINPTRPASDDEFEQMIAECEVEYDAGSGMSLEEAKALTEKKTVEWRKKNRK